MDESPVALSERELEVLKLVATGATNQQIARDLVISPNTVKVHLRNIFEKLGVQSRTEATMEAVRRGWVSVPGLNAEQAVLPEAQAVPAPVAPPPLPRWQRLYMAAAAIAVILALLFPFWWRARGSTPSASPLTDVGRPQAESPARQPVARWTAGAPLPEPLSRFALVAGPDRLYAIGGERATGVTDELWIYDPARNTWSPGPSKPTAVANVAGALLGERIFVPGGTTADGNATDVMEIYDLPSGRWEVGASLPRRLAAYALAAAGDRLYLFGGWDGERYVADTWIYDPVQGSWEQGRSMSAPRAFCAAAVLQDEIYVVGGFDGTQPSASVAVYRPRDEGTDAGPWSERASLSQPRAGLGAAAVRSTLYAVGGGWTEALAFNEQYDVRTGAWARIGTPVIGEWRNLGVATDGQHLYAMGGWSGSYLSLNEQYLALVRQLLPLGSKGG